MDEFVINVRYKCEDFDYWGRQNDPEYESQENEKPTEFDIDRKGWEMDKSAEYIISALLRLNDEDGGGHWPLWTSIMNSTMILDAAVLMREKLNLIEIEQAVEDGFHKIKMIVQTNALDELVKRIQAVDTRLVVELAE